MQVVGADLHLLSPPAEGNEAGIENGFPSDLPLPSAIKVSVIPRSASPPLYIPIAAVTMARGIDAASSVEMLLGI
jgi:hypothetical protein